MSKQAITSAATSIRQVPGLHRKVAGGIPGGWRIVDLGCGAFDDGIEYLRDHGHPVRGIDPYNRAERFNAEGREWLRAGTATAVVCANVLNVVREYDARAEVITEAARADLAFFTVYEGDASGRGRITPKGWQEHRRTRDYLPEVARWFPCVGMRRGVIVGAWSEAELRQALQMIH